jgi:signal peptidase I
MIPWVWSWALGAELLLLGLVPLLVGRRPLPYVVVAAAILVGITYNFLTPEVPADLLPLAYVLAAAVPLGMVGLAMAVEGLPAARYGFRLNPGSAPTVLGVAALLVGVYLLVTFESGFVTGFVRLPALPAETFALFFLTAPLLALGQEALFRGYLLNRLADRVAFRTALFVSAAVFALTALELRPLVGASSTTVVQAIFVSVVPAFVLGVLLGLFFYKTRWSLLGGTVVRTGILWTTLLLPFSAGSASWVTTFVFELLALGGMIVLLELAVQEPRFLQRRYLDTPLQPKRRTLIANAKERRQTVIALAALGVTVAVVLVAAPALGGEGAAPFHLYAIASGSMVPTFYRGELVLVKPVGSPSDLAVGDIIAYNAPYLSTEGPVVHRIVHVTLTDGRYTFTTKGDANRAPDPRPVNFSQVEGAYVAGVPWVGYLVLSPPLLAALVSVGFFATIVRASPASRRVRPRPVLPRPGEEAT